MKEREEQRGGKAVTVVAKEDRDLTPGERQAGLEARVAALGSDVADLKKALSKQGK